MPSSSSLTTPTTPSIPPPRLSVYSSAAWHKTLSSADQRDKLLRLLQYLLKLFRSLDNRPPTPASPTAALESTLGSARQLARLFKSLSVYATSSTSQTPTTITQLLTATNEAGLFLYYALDNVALLLKLRTLPFAPTHAPRFTRVAASFWLTALLAGAALEMMRLRTLLSSNRRKKQLEHADHNAQQRHDDNSTTDTGVATRLAVQNSKMRLVRLVADSVVALSLAKGSGVPASAVGAAGTLGSILSILLAWPRAA